MWDNEYKCAMLASASGRIWLQPTCVPWGAFDKVWILPRFKVILSTATWPALEWSSCLKSRSCRFPYLFQWVCENMLLPHATTGSALVSIVGVDGLHFLTVGTLLVAMKCNQSHKPHTTSTLCRALSKVLFAARHGSSARCRQQQALPGNVGGRGRS